MFASCAEPHEVDEREAASGAQQGSGSGYGAAEGQEGESETGLAGNDEDDSYDTGSIIHWHWDQHDCTAPSKGELSNQERNAIVLGPTTGGKSELLRALHRLYNSNRVPDSLQVGRGNVSTTAKVTKYPLQVSSISCKTVRKRDCGMGHKAMSEMMRIFKGGNKDSRDYYLDTYMAKPVYGKQTFRVNFLDCPGDKDSRGSGIDEQHFEEIAGELAQLGQISSVVFVIGKGMAYDSSFKTSFLYLWDWLKDHRRNFIMIHTKWSMLMLDVDEQKARVHEFENMFGEEAKQVKHIFIDSKWEDEVEGNRDGMAHHQQKKALAIQSVDALVANILMMPRLDCSSLQFNKTPAMLEIDRQLKASGDAALQAREHTLQQAKSELADVVRHLTDVAKKIGKHQQEVLPLRTRLAHIDNSDLCEIERKDVYLWHLWGWKTVTIQSTVPIREVKTYQTSGTVSWDKWEKTRYRIDVRCDSGSVPRYRLGSIIAYAHTRDMHTEEIQQLKDKLLPQEELLRQQEDIFRREESRESNKKEQVEKLAREIIGNQSVIAFSSQGTINLSDLPRINHWYKQIVGSQVEPSHVDELSRLIPSDPSSTS